MGLDFQLSFQPPFFLLTSSTGNVPWPQNINRQPSTLIYQNLTSSPVPSILTGLRHSCNWTSNPWMVIIQHVVLTAALHVGAFSDKMSTKHCCQQGPRSEGHKAPPMRPRDHYTWTQPVSKTLWQKSGRIWQLHCDHCGSLPFLLLCRSLRMKIERSCIIYANIYYVNLL